jgi:hypothetical protein
VESVVSAWYESRALCPFFIVCKEAAACAVSCPGTSIPEIVTVEVESDGTFKMELPDFSADPVASKYAEFGFSFKDVVLAGGYPNYRHISLEPESQDYRTEMGGLRLSPSYPSNVIFVARKRRSLRHHRVC